MKGKIENLEKKLKELVKEEKEKEGKGEESRIKIIGEGRMEKKIKEIERKLGGREREERKRNIVIRKVKADNENLRGDIEKVMREIGVEAELKKVRRVDAMQEGGKGTVMVTLGNAEKKRQIMEKKRRLRSEKRELMII